MRLASLLHPDTRDESIRVAEPLAVSPDASATWNDAPSHLGDSLYADAVSCPGCAAMSRQQAQSRVTLVKLCPHDCYLELAKALATL